jgi:flagellar protein FlbD
MIKLTRIHGEIVFINENNIQWIECLPDTTITFINGYRFIVKESVEQIMSLMKEQENSYSNGAHFSHTDEIKQASVLS